MDSLRYFVIECHVDGFRFDLASALAREFYEVDRLSAFFDIIHQDPVLSPGEADRRAVGRRPGRLPGRQLPGALDGVERHLPRHDARLLARRRRGRRLRAALHRLGRPLRERRPPAVRVDQLRHRARRLHARATSSPTTRSTTRRTSRTTATAPTTTAPGTAASRGRPTTRRCNALRARQQRNFLTTLLLSQGVPMLLGGDELGRTQGGNNNAWCQDNEISWFDWDDGRPASCSTFTQRLIALRARAPGLPPRATSSRRGDRLRAAGRLVVPPRRPQDDAPRLGARRRADARRFLNGAGDPDADAATGEPIADDSFLLLFNAHHEPIAFTLPARRFGLRWALELSTADPHASRGERRAARRASSVEGRSIVLLRRDFVTASARTYRLQLTPEFGFAAARELVPYLRELGVSHLYLSPSFQARPRLDARLRRRRPAPDLARSSAARRSSARSAEAGARGSCSTSSRTTWRRDEQTRSGGPSCATFFDLDRAHRRLPPLLRRRRARRRARRGPAGLRADAREGARARRARASSTACAIDHPDGLADPRGYLERLRAAGRRARLGREDPRAGRAAARLAGRGDDRLRVPERRHAPLRRPARRGAADRALRGADRRARDVRARSRPRRSSSRRGRRFEPEVERLRPALARGARASSAALAALHVYRTYVEPWTRPRRGRGPAADRGGRPPAGARARRCCSRSAATTSSSTRFQQTTGAVHGEGRRGHGVLPLRPARRAERGRRRPRPLRPRVDEFHAANLERAGASRGSC